MMSRTHFTNNSKSSFAKSFVVTEELRRQYDFFSESFLLKHVLDALPGIVLILNRHRQIIFANNAFCEQSGYKSSDSLCGHLVGDVLNCHIALDAEQGCGSGSACESCGALTAMLSSKSGEENVQECIITRRVGLVRQPLTLRVWTAPLHYENEEFTVLAGMDISHERRRLALERTFFHDIMNLVGSIRGFAELMEIDDSLEPLEVSRKIQFASQRVIEEIDSQRVLLAVEKGEFKADNHVLESMQILKDLVGLYEGHELARGRTIEIEKDAISVSFVSDATLLRRVLGNMIKNALEATPTGERVLLGVTSDSSSVEFWVHNQATIPKEYQQRIFQRDFSTKGAGRGLGTYSMKLLAHFLTGAVFFNSEEGYGTRFFLNIPLALKDD